MKTNWNHFDRFSLFGSVRAPRTSEAATPTPAAPRKNLTPAPSKLDAPIKKRVAAPPTDSMDDMLKAIDSSLILCDKTPRRLQIACLFPEAPFYTKLRAAIALQVGDVVSEKEAELILCTKAPEDLLLENHSSYKVGKKGDVTYVELLPLESYHADLKRHLWEMLKDRGCRR